MAAYNAARAAKIEKVYQGLCKLRGMPGFPTNEDALKLFAAAVSQFVSFKVKDHEILEGTFVPFDWLIEKVASSCEFFPPPIKMRRIYEQYWHPVDNKTASSLEAAADGEYL